MILIESRDFTKKIRTGGKLGCLLEKSGIRPDDFIAVKDGSVVTMDETLKDGDRVRLYPVISGG